MGTRDDEPRAGWNSRWRPINDRRIGGHHNFPGRPRRYWVDTTSGSGIEVPEDQAGRAPDGVPPAVQADTLRMMLARHEPADDKRCGCGLPLGELTGLCWYGRQAQKRLSELNLDPRADHPGEPDL
ncbi:hypothetical protein O7627_36050 [Solwaraspora sp. WMMD1047]|uniref:hypothetical protein n=1 Tax=Solwaraspora sp. WMMD1047 TaxID=3016102 RepID=UPI002416C99F|nr:hypothetical protein [Solwaraspora sp. WMMD1047]MDG4834684.1 hypothetical protein [Solwaraspora sp. WMMD1047]